jgi:two-component system chemotaxis sensor kinase CheA
MGVSDIQRLIFAPGFSTAEQVTNLSGRGVGMDVVRSNIERIGGKVDISSEQGKGTAIQIRIPLTLAIVPALLVTTQQQRFAIPQASLVELVRITGSKIRESLEEISGAHFFRLRGKLLPLVFLERVLEIGSPSVLAAGEDLDEQALNIVVVKADGSFFGVIVDCVHDTEEIVVKPLGKALKNVSVYAGATIMGDGKVALILDVPGIARRASVLSQRSNSEEQASRAHADERAELKQKLLLVSVGGNSRLAMPLSDVHRLEEFESSVIERASGQDVVQYRDSILPLIDLNAYLRLAPPVEIQEKRRVVVFQSEERAVGLVVSQVLDIVEEAIELQAKSSRPGIIGSAIVQKRVTDVLDLDRVISDGLHAISA